jgi:glycosyltransferase involved in cell wall biosynthesis
LTSQLPYPGYSGGTIKSRKVLDFFCLEHSVILIALIKNNDCENVSIFTKEYRLKLECFYHFTINKARSLVNYLKSIIYGIPISIYRNFDSEIKIKINNIIKQCKIDICFCDHLLMVGYIPGDFYSKTILHEHNAEYIIWRRYANIERNIIKKIIITFEAFRLFYYEIKQCKKVSVIMATPDDIGKLKPYLKYLKFAITYHLGNDDLLNEPKLLNKHTYKILFIGTLTWEANRQGILWFIKYVYPIIKKNLSNVSLYIVGKSDAPLLSLGLDKSIKMLGFVQDLKMIYNDVDIFICPLQFGSGMKIKVLDAMYRGLPIVTTSIGTESIDLVDGRDCFIADSIQDFAKKILLLLKNNDIWDKFSENSRLLAERQYKWEDEYKRLNSLLGKQS